MMLIGAISGEILTCSRSGLIISSSLSCTLLFIIIFTRSGTYAIQAPFIQPMTKPQKQLHVISFDTLKSLERHKPIFKQDKRELENLTINNSCVQVALKRLPVAIIVKCDERIQFYGNLKVSEILETWLLTSPPSPPYSILSPGPYWRVDGQMSCHGNLAV